MTFTEGLRFSEHVAQKLCASNHRIVITGAGGWLGLAVLELLDNAIDDFADRVRCFGSSARTLTLRNGHTVEQRPLVEIGRLDNRPTLVLHLAFLTKERVADMSEADYRQSNRALSETVLDALDRIGAVAVFVSSSGAARYENDPTAAPAMRLYGALKKADEDRFAGWAESRSTTAVIARVFNLSGPYINKHQNYALAAFILDALAERPVIVKAPHRVFRGSVAIREVMSLVFSLLLQNGRTVIRFDTAGEPLELEQIAQMVVDTLGGGPVERAAVTSAKSDVYAGEPGKYAKLLTENGVEALPLDVQIRETADYLAELVIEEHA